MVMASHVDAQTAENDFFLVSAGIKVNSENHNALATQYALTNTLIDLDGDGNMEFVTRADSLGSDGDCRIRLYERNATGFFSEKSKFTIPVVANGRGYIRSIFVANIDGDPAKEIVTIAESDNDEKSKIVIIDVSTDGLFTMTEHTNSPILALNNNDFTGLKYLGDLDEDGNPEMVSANFGTTDGLSVHEWNGAGWTVAVSASPNAGIISMDIGNLDTDDAYEIALIRDGYGSAAMQVWEVSESGGVFSLVADGTILHNFSRNITSFAQRRNHYVLLADLDLDSDNEIICVTADNDGTGTNTTTSLYVFERTGAGIYDRDIITVDGVASDALNIIAIAVANYDNDAGAEIYFSLENSQAVVFMEHDGTANDFSLSRFSGRTPIVSSMGSNVEAGAFGFYPAMDNSFDGDRQSDLLVATYTSTTNDLYFMEAKTTCFVGNKTIPAGNYFNIEVKGSSGSGATLAGDVVANGSLRLNSSKLNLAAYSLTVKDSVSSNAMANTIASDGLHSKLILQGSGPVDPIYMDQSLKGVSNRLHTLNLNKPGRTVTIANSMEILELINPEAGAFALLDTLILVSDASHTARVGAGSGTYISGGAVKVQRYIPAVGVRWRFLSSPVYNATFEDWRKELFITGEGTGNTAGTLNSNGFDATISNRPSAYWYNESKPGSRDSGWVAVSNTTASLINVPITPGKGYRLFVRGDRSDLGRISGTNATQNAVTLDVCGTLNMGDIVMPVSYTSSGSSTEDGFCFVGNPYASQYNWDNFWSSGNSGGNSGTNYTNIDPVIYVLDAASNSYKSYNALTHAGTLSGGIIPSGASFWVKATGASPVLTFKESFKSGTTAMGLFKAGSADQSLHIDMTLDSVNSDAFVLAFHSGAMRDNDRYDIEKFNNPSANISAITPDGKYHTLDTRPEMEQNDTVPLYIKGSDGNFRFTFSGALGNTRYFFLFDAFSQTFTRIDTISQYAFTISKANVATYGKRFILIVSPWPALEDTHTGIDDVKTGGRAGAQLVAWPNPAHDLCTVAVPGKAYTVDIYDRMGVCIKSSRFGYTFSGGFLYLHIGWLETGMYTLRLTDADGNAHTLKFIRQ